MRGYEDFNYPAFNTAAKFLRSHGWRVFNPAETDAEVHKQADDVEIPLRVYMQQDLPDVAASDVVFVLDSWEKSEGAGIETLVALKLKIPVYTYPDIQLVPPGCIEIPKTLFLPRGAEQDASLSIINCGPKTLFKDEETGGEKEESQARFDLIPPDALAMLARVYGMGAAKYAANNYLKGYPWHLSIAALERHVQKFKAGEDYDEESGLPHLSHAAWQAFTLVVFMLRGLGTDDRTKIEKAA